MRVGIIALQHESNTFIHQRTTLEDFRARTLLVGNPVVESFAGGHHEISGFIEGLRAAKLEIVPIFTAAATPGGTVEAATYDALRKMLLDELIRAGQVDGLLVAPHGAGVSESHPDMDGDWLSAVREVVGRGVPIVATLDPHANVSRKMIDACEAMIAYRTNPHLDQKSRGLQAAELMARTLRGEVSPVVAAALPPVSINIERQLTGAPPCKGLYKLAEQIRARPGVLSVSVILGFPYADVAEMGSGFIVAADNDRSLGQHYANELASYLVSHRQEFVGQMVDVDRAIDAALESPSPVCLLDMGDNIGGGSPGDGTVLAHALHDRRIDGAFVAIFDPDAVVRCASIGATLELSVGGKSDSLHGPPLRVRGTVLSLHDGMFTETQARHGGMTQHDMGPTAIVRSEQGMIIQLTSRRVPPFSLGQVTSCGIDPRSLRIIVAKGVHAPVAAYSPVCPTMIRVNTPGVTTADMTALDFKRRRRPMFPFEDQGIDEWQTRSSSSLASH